MSAYLLIDGPGLWAYQYHLQGGKTIKVGRANDNEIKLKNDSSVSAHHAVLLPHRDQWVVKDAQSSNGTYVNDERITEKLLQHGDTVRVGKTELVFVSQRGDVTSQFIDRTQVIRSGHGPGPRYDVPQAQPDDIPVTPTPAPARTPPAPIPPRAPQTRRPRPQDEDDDQMRDFEFDPDQYSTTDLKKEDKPSGSHGDMLWVAEQLANIFGDIAKTSRLGRKGMYERILEALREVIGADNGFLMIANRKQKRWVIRAWVGDTAEWDTYEKEHPVPLKIANQAFKEDHVVSNALEDDDQARSESMLLLDVHCYIAVPLRRQNRKEGVLYFDTRKSLRTFSERHVRLIERIGGYMLSVESEPHDTTGY